MCVILSRHAALKAAYKLVIIIRHELSASVQQMLRMTSCVGCLLVEVFFSSSQLNGCDELKTFVSQLKIFPTGAKPRQKIIFLKSNKFVAIVLIFLKHSKSTQYYLSSLVVCYKHNLVNSYYFISLAIRL